MKKTMMFVWVYFSTLIGVAISAVTWDGSSVPAEGSWAWLLAQITTAVLSIVIPAIGILIGRAIMHLISQIKDARLRSFAIDAVWFAEDKIGAKHGDDKLQEAVVKIMEKFKIPKAEAEIMARSAYQNIFKQLPPKNG